MFLPLRFTVTLLAVLLLKPIDSIAMAHGPDSGSFRQALVIPPGGYQELTIDVDDGFLFLTLIGDGSTNLDLVIYDDELGLLAISNRPGDYEHLQYLFGSPRTVHAVILNWGKTANRCTLSGY